MMNSSTMTITEMMLNNYYLAKVESIKQVMDADSFRARVKLGYGVLFEHLKGYRINGVDGPEMHSPDPIEKEAAKISTAVVAIRLAVAVATGKFYVVSKSMDLYGRWLVDMFTLKPGADPSQATSTDLVPSNFVESLLRDKVLRPYDGKKARTPWARMDLEYIIMNSRKLI
jgi:hypothetical protein